MELAILICKRHNLLSELIPAASLCEAAGINSPK
jgi:hypothetical protein